MLTACGPREIPAKGDFTVRVFDDTPVRFAPDIYPEAYNAPGADSIYHLGLFLFTSNCLCLLLSILICIAIPCCVFICCNRNAFNL